LEGGGGGGSWSLVEVLQRALLAFNIWLGFKFLVWSDAGGSAPMMI
jgi:hypothetical protein